MNARTTNRFTHCLGAWLLVSWVVSTVGCSSVAHTARPVAGSMVVREHAGYCQTRWTSLAPEEAPRAIQLSQRQAPALHTAEAIIVSAGIADLERDSYLPTDASPIDDFQLDDFQLNDQQAAIPADEPEVRVVEYVKPASFDYFQP